MRAALRRPTPNRAQKAIPIAIPSPVGGWNARDSLDNMKETDAVVLDNWMPGFGSCAIRNGSAPFVSSLGGPVRMLAEFNAGGLRTFIAGASGSIWDVTSGGSGVSLASGFGRDDWQCAQFDDAGGGARMGLVNGANAPQIYNGITLAAMTISGSGLTPSDLDGIHIYKSRSYFWNTRTQDFWYSAVNALGGTLTKFPLGRVQGTGGNIISIGTWSRDSGDGLDDLIVFVLSSGDVLIYAGDNPGIATDFTLAGRYTLGAAISKRAIKKIGADLVLVTKAGYVALNQILQTGRVNEAQSAISSKIQLAALQATAANAGPQWDLMHYPAGNMAIVNVPTSASASVQHVMNTATRAWSRFTGLNATCWGMFNDRAYFGTPAGAVSRFDVGKNDSGIAIAALGQPAWHYLRDRQRTKRATGLRVMLRATGPLSYRIGTAFDYGDIVLEQPIDLSIPVYSTPWDVSPWDTSRWSDETLSTGVWTGVQGDGYAVGMKLAIASATQGCEWLSHTFLREPGGVL